MDQEKTVKKLTKKETEHLNKIVPEYYKVKKEELALKKTLSTLNNDIKEILISHNLTDWTFGDSAVHISFKHEEKLNMDKTLSLFNDKFRDEAIKLGIIKTQEYIDPKALEAAMYKGEVPEELILELDKCRDKKDTPNLNLA